MIDSLASTDTVVDTPRVADDSLPAVLTDVPAADIPTDPDSAIAPSIDDIDTESVVGPSVTPVDSFETGSRHLRQAVDHVVQSARGLLEWIRRYFVHVVLLIGAVGVTWWSIVYVGNVRERRRFLTTTRLSIMDKEVQKACRHIEHNFADSELSPDTLCETLTTGKSFIEALYERELGMSVSDFITHVRVNHAKILLGKDPETPLDEVRVQTGFRTNDELLTAFARVTAVELDEYRQALSAGSRPDA